MPGKPVKSPFKLPLHRITIHRIASVIGSWRCRTKAFCSSVYDRDTDIHSVLYYTKKSADLQEEMIDNVLGNLDTMSADTERHSRG